MVTHINKLTFNLPGAAVLLAVLVATAGCPPAQRVVEESAPGTFLAAGNKLYSEREDFDIRHTVVYPEVEQEGLQDPDPYGTGQELTMNRCTWCHECGFEDAWDWDNYGSTEWSPRYTGEEWAPVVERMMQKEGSLLQVEQIVQHIYYYLRDDTLGIYDEEADDRGTIRIEVDELPLAPAPDDTTGGT